MELMGLGHCPVPRACRPTLRRSCTPRWLWKTPEFEGGAESPPLCIPGECAGVPAHPRIELLKGVFTRAGLTYLPGGKLVRAGASAAPTRSLEDCIREHPSAPRSEAFQGVRGRVARVPKRAGAYRGRRWAPISRATVARDTPIVRPIQPIEFPS